MEIVDSFDDEKDYNNDDGAISSNAVIAAEADAPTVPQIRTFAAATFLGRDITLLLSSLSS